MSPLDHLEELRFRILYSLFAWILGSIFCFFFAGKILGILTRPVPKLVALTPAEAFLIYIRIAMIGGLTLAAPFILIQLLLFFIPAMTAGERRKMMWIIPMGLLLFLMGASFINFILLPYALRFFLSYTTGKIEAMISLSRYVDFVITFLLAGGIAFELPLVIMGLGKIGIVKASLLRKYRKIAILLILLSTGVLSPSPDVYSWLLFSGILYGLFEFSIFLVKIVEPRI